MNFSFSGCGFLGIYHVGVAACLKTYAPDIIAKAKFSGASAGSLAAICLLCDSPLGVITSTVLKTVQDARTRLLGPFSPTFNVEKLLREGLFSVLPDNAHEIVNGRVSISVTRLSDGKNVLLTHFDTFDELIQAMLCSAFIPGFSGWVPPKIKGVRYVDGGFTNNLPMIDHDTITVSPFSGEADICPKDQNSGIMTLCLANTSIELSEENLYRFSFIVWPPPPEVMNKICQQGFNDTLDFLQRRSLLSCTRCLSVHSTINVENSKQNMQQDFPYYHDELTCADCALQRQQAYLDDLPEAVGSLLQDAVDQANIKLTNWIFKHKSQKLLTILTLPYTLPKDIGYALYNSLLKTSPGETSLVNYASHLVQLLKALYRSWSKKTTPVHHHRPKRHSRGKFICQLNITEYTGDEKSAIVGDNKQQFDFNMDTDEMDGIPETHRDVTSMESLNQLAVRCAARSLSKQASRVASRNPSRMGSRAISRAVSRIPSMEDLSTQSPEWEDVSHHIKGDAFTRILDVTNQQDAIMAYYYKDENDEMQVTEIFDLSQVSPDQLKEGGSVHQQAEPLSEEILQSHLQSLTAFQEEDEEDREVVDFYDNCLYSSLSSTQSLERNSQSEPEVDQTYY